VSYLGGARGKGAVIAQSDSKEIVEELKDDDFPPTLLAVAEVHGSRDCGSWRVSNSTLKPNQRADPVWQVGSLI